MDDYLSLRSLEGSGRPFGTERPPTSSERTREHKSDKGKLSLDSSDDVREREGARENRPEPSDFSRELEAAATKPEPALPEEAAPQVAPPQLTQESQTEPLPGEFAAPALLETPQLLSELPEPEVKLPLAQSFDSGPSTAELAPSPVAPELTAALAPALAPTIAPATAQAPINAAANAEAPTLELASSLASQVEIATNLDAGSGSLDAEAGGLTNQAAEQNAGSASKSDASALQFEQALAETANKAATSPAKSIEVAENVLRQFKVQVHSKLDRAMIQLRPAELGRISIAIEMDRGKLRAVMRADKAETLELLERHVPELRASLEGSGIQAESFDFGLGLEQDGASDAQLPAASGWKDQTEPILEELEQRSLLAKSFVNDKRVDTYA